ncbi:hypothetical protein B0H63DRAFT_533640 [Podospora didyma]|uniref:Uncharacterized protein n=1 Tax=Podospora didyma TaxID=330526 RepID=A0AAE0U8P5_9PEZI|nr:hypothetical protein B0H63DRAFT_533640 [Podospora didyma]
MAPIQVANVYRFLAENGLSSVVNEIDLLRARDEINNTTTVSGEPQAASSSSSSSSHEEWTSGLPAIIVLTALGLAVLGFICFIVLLKIRQRRRKEEVDIESEIEMRDKVAEEAAKRATPVVTVTTPPPASGRTGSYGKWLARKQAKEESGVAAKLREEQKQKAAQNKQYWDEIRKNRARETAAAAERAAQGAASGSTSQNNQ